MDINQLTWAYAISRPGQPLEMIRTRGPIFPDNLREILGGEYELIPLMDGTYIAALKDRAHLPPNEKYQSGINGPLVTGKMDGDVFVGLLGTNL